MDRGAASSWCGGSTVETVWLVAPAAGQDNVTHNEALNSSGSIDVEHFHSLAYCWRPKSNTGPRNPIAPDCDVILMYHRTRRGRWDSHANFACETRDESAVAWFFARPIQSSIRCGLCLDACRGVDSETERIQPEHELPKSRVGDRVEQGHVFEEEP